VTEALAGEPRRVVLPASPIRKSGSGKSILYAESPPQQQQQQPHLMPSSPEHLPPLTRATMAQPMSPSARLLQKLPDTTARSPIRRDSSLLGAVTTPPRSSLHLSDSELTPSKMYGASIYSDESEHVVSRVGAGPGAGSGAGSGTVLVDEYEIIVTASRGAIALAQTGSSLGALIGAGFAAAFVDGPAERVHPTGVLRALLDAKNPPAASATASAAQVGPKPAIVSVAGHEFLLEVSRTEWRGRALAKYRIY
jgi:hypothetical protein